MSDTKLKTLARENPRAMTLLFGAVMLFTQIGTVAAGVGCTYPGP